MMAEQHNPLDNKVKLPYNGWRIPLREIYYGAGFIAIMGTLIGAWYDVTGKQEIALYRLDEMQRTQAERTVAIEKLATRVTAGEIERGKIATQLQAIADALRRTPSPIQ